MSAVTLEGRGGLKDGWQRHSDGDVHDIVERLGTGTEADVKAACPVRTGQLRDSIKHEADDATVRTRRGARYVGYVEKVTCYPDVEPLLRSRLFRVRSL